MIVIFWAGSMELEIISSISTHTSSYQVGPTDCCIARRAEDSHVPVLTNSTKAVHWVCGKCQLNISDVKIMFKCSEFDLSEIY